MRFVSLSAGALVAAFLIVAPASAGQHGNSGAHVPSPVPKAPTTTVHGPATGPKSTTPDGSSPTAKGKSTTGDGTSTNTTGTTTTGTVDFTSGKAGQLLTKNSALRSRLETRLQALGYTGTVYQAAYGFKNVGQFVAATNVAQNLGIPFAQLKLQMTGLSVSPAGVVLRANMLPNGTITMVSPAAATSPAPTKSLGQSIQTLKSGVDATTTARTATKAADAEIAGTTSTSH